MLSREDLLNRGQEIHIHPTGMHIYMCVGTTEHPEWAEPGVYRSANGSEIAEALAEQAGFDVEFYRKERLKKERRAQVMAALEEEFMSGAGARQTIKELGVFKLVHIGMGRHVIEDADGNVLTARHLTEKEGHSVLRQLVPVETDAPVELGDAEA